MTSDLERYRAIIIALEAECAAYREVLAAIRDRVAAPRPRLPSREAVDIARYRRNAEQFENEQRTRVLEVQGAAGWALGDHREESAYLTDAELILIGARHLRDETARPLPYEAAADD